MKKVLTYVLSLVAVAALAIGGTLAYLTDQTETKTNVFEVGNVDIELKEDVAVIGEGGSVKTDETGAQYSTVMPGDYLKKVVTVTNEGNAAYVAITVTLNNARQINKAIDDVYEAKGYTAEQIQEIYDFIFDGWGLNHSKDLDGDGQSDAGMRLTITGDDMPEHVLHVDSVKTLTDYAQYYNGNWFGEKTIKYPSANDVYKKDMGKYEIKYTYYAYLENGESTTLFKGLNVPAEFDSKQLEMFAGLEIDVKAAAIQAENMGVAAEFQGQDNAEAKTAFAILAGKVDEVDLGVNNKPIEVESMSELKDAIKNTDGNVVIDAQNKELGGINSYVLPAGKEITIMNATFNGSNGIKELYSYSKVTFINCKFLGRTYGAHVGGGDQEVTFENCYFEGWNSFAATVPSVTFNNCTFAKGNSGYGSVRFYQDGTFNNCTFEEDFIFIDSAKEGTTITLNNCTNKTPKTYDELINIDETVKCIIDGVEL